MLFFYFKGVGGFDDYFGALFIGGEDEALGVEHEAGGTELVFAIDGIAVDGGVHVAHVNAQLVGAPGEEEKTDELFGVGFLFDDVASVGKLAAGFDSHHFVILIGHGDDVGFDVAGVFEIIWFGNDGEIFFLSEVFFENVVEILIEGMRAGEEDDTGGIFI